MTYKDVVSWMFRQLPVYQKIGAKAFKKDLSNSIKFSEHLSNPERGFKSIHVGGTNGKGSTSHMLASIFQEAGYKTGLYTSPHLKDFRERIKINGEPVSEKFVVEFIQKNKSVLEQMQLSFFEMTVGMAFKYFESQKVDIAIIEVGLGGRLDSTNIIVPEISVITNIGLDHTSMLGNSLEKIAFEKAGIIKDNRPVVIGETQPETTSVFLGKAEEKRSEIYFADQEISFVLPSDLLGDYQIRNIKTVIQTIIIARNIGFNITDSNLKKGLLNVVVNTGLLGRWQILGMQPLVICDTAHNKEGLSIVIQQLKKLKYDSLHMVFGVVKDKDLESILPLMPKEAIYYFCRPNIERGMSTVDLRRLFLNIGIEGNSYPSVSKALQAAKSAASPEDLIYIGGSTFVVAEVV